MGVHCCCLHVNYIVYKHLNTWVHFWPSKPVCLWSFIHISNRVFAWAKFVCHTTMDILLYAKVSLLYNVLWDCIVVVYKHFERSLHVESADPTCVQNFRPVPFTVFEIQGFKLKNKNDKKKKKNWRNGPFAISPMLVVQFYPNFRCTYILTSAIILWCQKWIITDSESANWNFRMYRHNGPRPRPSLYTKYSCTLWYALAIVYTTVVGEMAVLPPPVHMQSHYTTAACLRVQCAHFHTATPFQNILLSTSN